jgi:hypothetical protein
MCRAVADPTMRMKKKAVRTAESHRSISRRDRISSRVRGRVGSGLRLERGASRGVIIELQNCHGYDSTITAVGGHWQRENLARYAHRTIWDDGGNEEFRHNIVRRSYRPKIANDRAARNVKRAHDRD